MKYLLSWPEFQLLYLELIKLRVIITLEVVCRGSKPQLHVGGKLIKLYLSLSFRG